MPIVPIAQTGLVAEYPLASSKRFHTTSIRFLDGDMQCFPSRKSPSFHWQMKYQQLSTNEVHVWLPFLESALRDQTAFEFTDPVTATVHGGSRITGTAVEVEQEGVERARIEISILKEGD